MHDTQRSVAELVERVKQTAQWCSLQLLQGNTRLRSQLRQSQFTHITLTLIDTKLREDFIRHVFDDRARFQASLYRLESLPASSGKLLVFFPEISMHDVAAESASNGFFEIGNAPPWDTWVDYLKVDKNGNQHLLAWIPPNYIETANRGIEVAPDENILWLENLQGSLNYASDLLTAIADHNY